MIQGSPEWLDARLGKVTASRVGDIVARTKAGKPTAERERYLMELVAERLTGLTASNFVSAAMLHGSEMEPVAARAYGLLYGLDTAQVGFVPHPTIAGTGASPDRLVGADGLLEVKCPTTRVHLETILSGAIPAEHLPQMHWQMACTGRAWNDFVSYDDRVPDSMRAFVVRLPRDEAEIERLEAEVVAFLAEVDARAARLAELCALDAQPTERAA